MESIQAYKLVIEYKESITQEEVRNWLEPILVKTVDRLAGLSFNGVGDCEFGKFISARLVIEHSALVSAEKLQAILNVPHDSVRIVQVHNGD